MKKIKTATARSGDPGWVGHKWKMRGFYSDECTYCGLIAVEGHNGLAANEAHCEVRAKAQNATKTATATTMSSDVTRPDFSLVSQVGLYEWPCSEGIWERDGEEWSVKITDDGEIWIVPPDPEDGCVARSFARLVHPHLLKGWSKKPNDPALAEKN